MIHGWRFNSALKRQSSKSPTCNRGVVEFSLEAAMEIAPE